MFSQEEWSWEWGCGRRAQTSNLVSLISSKELKDPDQLYTTLKNLLAQIKVGGQDPLVSNSSGWQSSVGQ